MARLTQSDCLHITELSVMGRLGAAATHQHANNSACSSLQSLTLRRVQLDETAMTALIQGNWPWLNSLLLQSIPSLRPAATALPQQPAGGL